MAAVNFAAIRAPLGADEPCGPDLDLEGDVDYLNGVATVQGLLPQRFFDKPEEAPPETETKAFDPGGFNFKPIYAALGPLLEKKTHDLRLLSLLTQSLALQRDLAGLADATEVTADLLEQHWDTVNPRAEEGDFALRGIALSSLNSPTIEFALQYVPFAESRRTGPISYRSAMFARGEAKPREGEKAVALAEIEQTLRDNADDVTASRAAVEKARMSTARWLAAFADKGRTEDAPTLDRFASMLDKIAAFIDSVLNPQHAASDQAAEGADVVRESLSAAGSSAPAGAVATAADARAALAAVAAYFTTREPSSPVLPLVLQAQALQGKSFFDAMQVLMPNRIGEANFQIGQRQVFDLPLQRINEAVGPPTADVVEADASSVEAFAPTSRQQAMALLGQVAAYFRQAEPSSPVPWLTERARALAEQDFLSLLRTVLPRAALRDLTD